MVDSRRLVGAVLKWQREHRLGLLWFGGWLSMTAGVAKDWTDWAKSLGVALLALALLHSIAEIRSGPDSEPGE